jgi:predicted MFS family arabinose efflux permease
MVVYIVRDTEGAWRLLMASFALPAFALLADYVIYLYKEIKLKKLKHFSDFIFPCIYLIIGLITVIGIILYVVS